jgi:hypothetical protein
MAADRARVEWIVASALALGPAAREALLEQACGDDAALRTWVEALIRAREHPVIEEDAGPASAPASAPSGMNGEGRPEQIARSLATAGLSGGLDLSFLAPSAKPGSLGRLGSYEILEVLGQGSVGVVFRALEEKHQRVVAIKVLLPSLAANVATRRRFVEEGRAAAAIQHENVIAIHAAYEQPIPFVVMEYVDGPSLQVKLAETGPLELKQILRIGHQIAAGLAAAHRQGLLHRAIKPGNILLAHGVERVKITDFGLASLAVGSPTYMAPEQALADEVDERADLFSLGTLLYMLCTGRPPFGETSSLAILKHMVEDPPRDIRELNRDVPPWLCEIIGKLHAKMPGERYQSAAEVAAVLVARLAELQLRGEVSPGPREGPAAAQPSRRGFWRAAAAMLGFVIVFGDLLLAYYYDLPPFPSRDRAPDSEGQLEAPRVGVLEIQVADDRLRLTVRAVGGRPHTYAHEAEGKAQSFTVQPGRLWVHATRDGVTVFEKFVEVTAGERKTVTIDARPDELPPERGPREL